MGQYSRGPSLQRGCLMSGHLQAKVNRGCGASAPTNPFPKTPKRNLMEDSLFVATS